MKSTPFIYLFTILSLFQLTVSAQNLQDAIPFDSKLKHGKLKNGLTYYIYPNTNSAQKGYATFELVTLASPILEEDNEVGVSHFIEHLSFKTKNFPQGATEYIQSLGGRVGGNINASVGGTRTKHYLFNISLKQENSLDSCLLILHDIAAFVSFSEERIDSERKVIIEELRRKNNASWRMFRKQMIDLFGESRYANMETLGTMETLEKMNLQIIENYYKKWYRPDLQAVIVVGDIDADVVEKKLMDMFSDVPKPKTLIEIAYPKIPYNKEPIVSIATDQEATSINLQISYKHDRIPTKKQKSTREGYLLGFVRQFISEMMNERLKEIINTSNSPFKNANANEGGIGVPINAWNLKATCKEESIKESFITLMRENERARRFGFTKNELERRKRIMLNHYEREAGKKDKMEDSYIVYLLEYSFLDGNAVPCPVDEYEVVKDVLSRIDIEMVNETMKSLISDENIYITLSGPEKDGMTYPSELELISLLKETEFPGLKPYKDVLENKVLMKKSPKKGKIIKEEDGELDNEKVWILSNNAKVIFKRMDTDEDEIYIIAKAKGGMATFTEQERKEKRDMFSLVSIGGLGSLNKAELDKYLSDKKIKVNEYNSMLYKRIEGTSCSKDIETMFQVLYLTFISPHKDENAFRKYKEKKITTHESDQLNPDAFFNSMLSIAKYGDSSKSPSLNQKKLEKLNYDKLLKARDEYYEDASSFVFTIVGNVKEEEIRPLVEKYLASLPAKKKKSETKPYFIPEINKGIHSKHFTRKMNNPKSTIYNLYTASIPYDEKNSLIMNMLTRWLQQEIKSVIRGKEGAAYEVSVQGGFSELPENEIQIQIKFDTKPGREENMNEIVHELMNTLSNTVMGESQMKRFKTQMANYWHTASMKNNYWANRLNDFYQTMKKEDYIATLNSLTSEDIKNLLGEILSQKNHIELIMSPE